MIANIGRQRGRDMSDKKEEPDASGQGDSSQREPTPHEMTKAYYREEGKRLEKLALAVDGLIHLPKAASKEEQNLWQTILFLYVFLAACGLLYFSYTDPARLAAQLALGAAAGWIFSSTNRQIESTLYFGLSAPLLIRILAFSAVLILLGFLLFHFLIETAAVLFVGLTIGHLWLQQKHPVRTLSDVISAPYGGAYQMGLILLLTLMAFLPALLLNLGILYVSSAYALIALYLKMTRWQNARRHFATALFVWSFMISIILLLGAEKKDFPTIFHSIG